MVEKEINKKRFVFKSIPELKMSIPVKCAVALIVLFMFIWGLVIGGAIK